MSLARFDRFEKTQEIVRVRQADVGWRIGGVASNGLLEALDREAQGRVRQLMPEVAAFQV